MCIYRKINNNTLSKKWSLEDIAEIGKGFLVNTRLELDLKKKKQIQLGREKKQKLTIVSNTCDMFGQKWNSVTGIER